MSKWIEKISRKIGFTQTEVNIILFLLTTFLIGLVINFIKESKNDSNYLEMNYTAQDSLFNMAIGPVESNDSSSVADSQKAVASKNELLDFGEGKKRESAKRKADELPNKVDVNHATAAQLAAIQGIGKNTAQNIVDYREKKGDFTKAEQLLNVKGVGKAKLEKLKKIIIFK